VPARPAAYADGMGGRSTTLGVVAAATAHTDGLGTGDVAWLLEHAPGAVAVVRPANERALAAV
jgi:hypothetical protein